MCTTSTKIANCAQVYFLAIFMFTSPPYNVINLFCRVAIKVEWSPIDVQLILLVKYWTMKSKQQGLYLGQTLLFWGLMNNSMFLV